MIGEFEFEGIFYAEEIPAPFPGMTYAFFVGFLIIMSVIIVNLLVGLAVDDIKAVQEQAELKRLVMQVEQVLDVERMMPDFLYKRSIVKLKIYSKLHREEYVEEFVRHGEMKEKMKSGDKQKEIEQNEQKLVKQLAEDVQEMKRENAEMKTALLAFLKKDSDNFSARSTQPASPIGGSDSDRGHRRRRHRKFRDQN